MSFACEHCVKRLGVAKAPRYQTLEELRTHMREAHPTLEQKPKAEPEPKPEPKSAVELERQVDQLVKWLKSKAVVGPAGEPYREALRKAREVGLIGS